MVFFSRFYRCFYTISRQIPPTFPSPKFSSKQISTGPSQANRRSPNTVAESPFAAETEYCASKVEIFKTCDFVAWIGVIFKGILATPPKATPPRNKGLIRPY